MVRTPPTALAGKAGLYKRGMTWNLWWLGHSASAWTSCWGTQAGFPHPVVWMGRAISGLEERLRRIFPKTTRGEWAAGALLAILLPAGTLALTFSVLWLAGQIHPGLRFFLEVFWGWQALAVRGLGKESSRVYRALRGGNSGAGPAGGGPHRGTGHPEAGRAGSPGRRWRLWRKTFPMEWRRLCFTFSWAALPWPSAIRPSIPWTVWWGTGMNGISTLAAGRPGWTMEPTGFPPSVGVAAGGGGLALGGGWERCLADLAPGPAQPRQPQRSCKQRRRWPERWGFSWPDQLGILGYGWKNRPLESISA